MQITTVAVPIAMTHSFVDQATAPVWIDSLGNQYQIASGMLANPIDSTDHTVATPNQITVIVGVEGLTALAQMGLTPKGETDE